MEILLGASIALSLGALLCSIPVFLWADEEVQGEEEEPPPTAVGAGDEAIALLAITRRRKMRHKF